MPSFSSLEENLGWQSRVPDYYLSDPDMPPPGWHDYEPASSVQLHVESGSEPDIWSAPWWLYPPVIIHSSVYSTVKYVIVQRIVYSSVKYEIVQRTVYSTVYCKVCDNSYCKVQRMWFFQLKDKIVISNFNILNTTKYSQIFLSVFLPHEKNCTENNYQYLYLCKDRSIFLISTFEKIPTLPFSVNLATFFSAFLSFLSGGVMSILVRPFFRGDRCDALWLLCVGTTDSPSLSSSSEADLNI